MDTFENDFWSPGGEMCGLGPVEDPLLSALSAGEEAALGALKTGISLPGFVL